MARLVAVAVVAVVLAVAPVGRSEAAETYLSDAGYGMAAIGANLFYIPAKLLYGLGGGLVGGLAYGLTVGNSDAAQYILSPSLGGTWVLSSKMMAGQEPIFFSGESYEPATQTPAGS